jgi:hypothetical protein
MRGNKRAPALAAHHQVVGSHLVDGLAHRALADAVAGGQFDLGRNRLAGLPFARLQALQNQAFDLPVQRTE